MNKTVNINIGGLFFHIDEDAYQKLSRYFDAIKRSLSNSSGKDEIMKDIEMRVAECVVRGALTCLSTKRAIMLLPVDAIRIFVYADYDFCDNIVFVKECVVRHYNAQLTLPVPAVI